MIKCKHYDSSPRPGRFNPARVTFRRMVGGNLTVREHYVCEACAEELEHFFALRAELGAVPSEAERQWRASEGLRPVCVACQGACAPPPDLTRGFVCSICNAPNPPIEPRP